MTTSPFSENNGAVAPDGHWIAYDSDESGRPEIYVRPFPNVTDGRFQVSSGGGTNAVWSGDGAELFYLRSPGTLMAVPVELGRSFAAGTPELLLEGDYLRPTLGTPYDVAADASRFLMIKNAAEDTAANSRIVVVLDWHQELLERVPIP